MASPRKATSTQPAAPAAVLPGHVPAIGATPTMDGSQGSPDGTRGRLLASKRRLARKEAPLLVPPGRLRTCLGHTLLTLPKIRWVLVQFLLAVAVFFVAEWLVSRPLPMDSNAAGRLQVQYAEAADCGKDWSADGDEDGSSGCMRCQQLLGQPDSSYGCGLHCNAALISLPAPRRLPSVYDLAAPQSGLVTVEFAFESSPYHPVTLRISEAWVGGFVGEVTLTGQGHSVMSWKGDDPTSCGGSLRIRDWTPGSWFGRVPIDGARIEVKDIVRMVPASAQAGTPSQTAAFGNASLPTRLGYPAIDAVTLESTTVTPAMPAWHLIWLLFGFATVLIGGPLFTILVRERLINPRLSLVVLKKQWFKFGGLIQFLLSVGQMGLLLTMLIDLPFGKRRGEIAFSSFPWLAMSSLTAAGWAVGLGCGKRRTWKYRALHGAAASQQAAQGFAAGLTPDNAMSVSVGVGSAVVSAYWRVAFRVAVFNRNLGDAPVVLLPIVSTLWVVVTLWPCRHYLLGRKPAGSASNPYSTINAALLPSGGGWLASRARSLLSPRVKHETPEARRRRLAATSIQEAYRARAFRGRLDRHMAERAKLLGGDDGSPAAGGGDGTAGSASGAGAGAGVGVGAGAGAGAGAGTDTAAATGGGRGGMAGGASAAGHSRLRRRNSLVRARRRLCMDVTSLPGTLRLGSDRRLPVAATHLFGDVVQSTPLPPRSQLVPRPADADGRAAWGGDAASTVASAGAGSVVVSLTPATVGVATPTTTAATPTPTATPAAAAGAGAQERSAVAEQAANAGRLRLLLGRSTPGLRLEDATASAGAVLSSEPDERKDGHAPGSSSPTASEVGPAAASSDATAPEGGGGGVVPAVPASAATMPGSPLPAPYDDLPGLLVGEPCPGATDATALPPVVPPTWETAPFAREVSGGKVVRHLQFALVPVAAGSDEWAAVSAMFRSTGVADARMTGLLRVQNPTAWRRHRFRVMELREQCARAAMLAELDADPDEDPAETTKEGTPQESKTAAGPDGTAKGKGKDKKHKKGDKRTGGQLPRVHHREFMLWHGTSNTARRSITDTGFRVSYSKRSVFGAGVYFATRAQMAMLYRKSHPEVVKSASTTHELMLVRVAVGSISRGRSKLRGPSYTGGDHGLWDTTVDKLDKPTIIAVFSDAQAYPAYVVKYRLDPPSTGAK